MPTMQKDEGMMMDSVMLTRERLKQRLYDRATPQVVAQIVANREYRLRAIESIFAPSLRGVTGNESTKPKPVTGMRYCKYGNHNAPESLFKGSYCARCRAEYDHARRELRNERYAMKKDAARERARKEGVE